jgi:Adenylate cyclase associated (CAP) N terminal
MQSHRTHRRAHEVYFTLAIVAISDQLKIGYFGLFLCVVIEQRLSSAAYFRVFFLHWSSAATQRFSVCLITMSLDSAIDALVKRLEVVTARLEKVEGQLASGVLSGPVASSGSSSAGSAGADGASSQSVQEYDILINQYIRPYVELSGKLDPTVKQQV